MDNNFFSSAGTVSSGSLDSSDSAAPRWYLWIGELQVGGGGGGAV